MLSRIESFASLARTSHGCDLVRGVIALPVYSTHKWNKIESLHVAFYIIVYMVIMGIMVIESRHAARRREEIKEC